MQSTSALYKQIFSGTHTKEFKAAIAGTDYGTGKITGLTTIGKLFNASAPSVGNAIAKEIDISLKPTGTIPRMAEIIPSIRLVNSSNVSEWIQKGVYYIDTRQADPLTGILQIHGYDAMLKAEQPFAESEMVGVSYGIFKTTANYNGGTSQSISSLSLYWKTADASSTPGVGSYIVFANGYMREVTRKSGTTYTLRAPVFPSAYPMPDLMAVFIAASQMGVNVDARTVSLLTHGYEIQFPGVGDQAYSTREVIGYIAAMYAANAMISDLGELLFIPLVSTGTPEDLGDKVETFYVNNSVNAIGTVHLLVAQDTEYTAGTSGESIDITCPWGTQAIANNLLTALQGYHYIPFTADQAFLDPAFEFGDRVTIDSETVTPSEITIAYDLLCAADIASPDNGEIEHEYPYVSRTKGEIARQVANSTASLRIDVDSISSRVESVEQDAIGSVTVLYALSNSTTTAPTTGWSAVAPQWTSGKYMWQKTQTINVDGTVSESNPTCIAGAKGADGAAGEDGIGITSIIPEYYLSTSASSTVGGSWSTTSPTWSAGHYIWTRSHIYWDDGTNTTTTPQLDNTANGLGQRYSEIKQEVDGIVSTVEGKISTFRQSTVPTATARGDLWYATADVSTYKAGQLYRWSGSAWQESSESVDVAPAWSSSHGTYNVGDHVEYQANWYRCITQHTSSTARLPTNTTYWTRVTTISDISKSQVEQLANSLTLSVSGTTGTTTFQLKQGNTTLSTQNFDIHVNAVNIVGSLSVDNIRMYGKMTIYQNRTDNTVGGYFGYFYDAAYGGYGVGLETPLTTSNQIGAMFVTTTSARIGYSTALNGSAALYMLGGRAELGASSGIHYAANGEAFATQSGAYHHWYVAANEVAALGAASFRPVQDSTFPGVGLTLGASGYKWDVVYARQGTIASSDRKQKKEINYDIANYDALFDALKPASFKFIINSSDRTHVGFIAQDVEDAMTAAGITSQDFAGFVKSPIYSELDDDGNYDTSSELLRYDYGLRYEEFIALCVNEIQKLKKRLDRLEGVA